MSQVSLTKVQQVVKSLVRKASGPDGGTNGILRHLPPLAVKDLHKLFCLVEQTGEVPQQWRTSQIALLVKNQEIERPIALCHVAYKCWLKCRYSLVSGWLEKFKHIAPWDAARPGVAAIDICVKRVLLAEIAGARQKTQNFSFLGFKYFLRDCFAQSDAIQMGFPFVVLNGAIQVYRGARILQGDSQASPPAYSQRGILAGCPVDARSPALSKVVLCPACKRVHEAGLAEVLDTWIDDISADVEHANPQIAARKAFRPFTLFKDLLPTSELLLNFKKSAFTCSDVKAVGALRKFLGPEVCGVVKDLGVDNSAGRRRRIPQAKTRLQKASARSSKLRKLGVPSKLSVRTSRVGVQTAATWGHQAQGLVPKRLQQGNMQQGNL